MRAINRAFRGRLNQLARAIKKAFTPASLFTAGEQGVWYDPSDLSTMFTDAAGTTPVAAPGSGGATEPVVGLMLDKSKGLGPELVTNGDFSAGTMRWTVTAGSTSVVAGKLRLTRANSGSYFGGRFGQGESTQIGKTYKVSIEYSVGTAGPCIFRVTNNADQSLDARNFFVYLVPGVNTFYVQATETTTYFVVASTSGDTGTYSEVDNISVRELPGNHATQSTSTQRPTLSARVNGLRGTEDLTSASWVPVGSATRTTSELTVTNNADDGIYQTASAYLGSVAAGVSITSSVEMSGSGTVRLSVLNGVGIDIGTKIINLTSVPTRYSVTATNNFAGTNIGINIRGNGAANTFSVSKADFRFADQATGLLPAYQRVNTSTDYDTTGFPKGEDFNGSNSYLSAASGGGGTTAFLFCASITVKKVGATQTLFSDTGTNTGYRVRINSSNQIELSAGNSSSFTTIATANTVTLGKSHVVTAWHDGTNLQVQLDNGTVAQTAFATASAGTAGFTIGTDNGTAGNWFQGRIFEYVYRKNTVPTAADISNTKTYCASKAAIA